MGQKINPKGFRLGVLYPWVSRWYADDKRYKTLLLEDIRLRLALEEKLKNAGLSRVEIERSINRIDIIVYVVRPGVVIGRGGTGLEDLKKYVNTFLKKQNQKSILKIELKVEPVKEPNLDATIVAKNIAEQLAKRMPHKRVSNQAIERVMGSGAKGVRILLAGRIAGAEISRREKFQKGTVPLSTIREDVDYAEIPSLTKSGYIGVKVWIAKGEKVA
ncbi:MAG: 30S ribosomal protein S3 [Candidatus Gottesmanbacteria bacterium GW2011_GWA1_34_13]|uniref:Small ribosomal subunit protein uS3 n=1 Tax=Candidatus Gottesmanbacteria bacterium GW2011_GWA1_34_13 TaxID=1618434 RepID=A0A0G0ASD5_9BACT|nr:MAG: 30S ribosomal protein S3 [Candidatus Gottesmanbacteria bacterium GW2011_GWA1_34_13]